MKTNGTSHGDLDRKIASLAAAIARNEWKVFRLETRLNLYAQEIDERIEKLERRKKRSGK